MKTLYQQHFKTVMLAFLLGILLMSSCKKDRTLAPEPKGQEITGTKGIYVLAEGTMGNNNSTLTYYDVATKKVETFYDDATKKISADYFKKINGRPLGETANDLKAYGSKMYCVVAGVQGKAQSFVEVIDIATGKSLKSISFNANGDGQMPRYIAFYKNKAYVSRYDGKISRIDTASLAVDAELQLMNGTSPAGGLEGLAVANGKLYVTNSDHPYYPNGLKNKVTVIDLATFTKTKDIAVSHNPVKIAAAQNGDLLVVTWGDYGAVKPVLQRINSATDAVTASYDYNVGPIAIYKNKSYLITDWNMNSLTLDLTSGATGKIITDATATSTLYGVTVNPFDESVVVADAISFGSDVGKAIVFDKNGKFKYDFATGALPQHAVFNYSYK